MQIFIEDSSSNITVKRWADEFKWDGVVQKTQPLLNKLMSFTEWFGMTDVLLSRKYLSP